MGSIPIRLASLAAAAGLLLAGCSDDPVPREPDPAPTSATPSPTLTPPVLPEEAKADTSSGAANFASHWLDVSDYAAWTGDTAALAAISSEDCAPCDRFVDLYDKTYADGGFYKGGRHTLSDISVAASDDGDVVLVKATSELSAGTYRETSTSEVVEVDGETNRLVYRVERVGERWVMAAMALEDE